MILFRLSEYLIFFPTYIVIGWDFFYKFACPNALTYDYMGIV